MGKPAVKSESARSRRRRLDRAMAKKVALAGAISATAIAVGLTPTIANAVSSQTYFVGFPGWLPIGEGSTLPSDSVAINNAIVAAKDHDPLVAWGIGDVDLKPTWVKWYTPVNPFDPTNPSQDQFYTPGEYGQTGSHTATYTGANPLYQPAYDAAYSLAYNYNVAYAVVYARIAQAAYNEAYARLSSGCGGGFLGNACRTLAATKATAEAKAVADAQAPGVATAEATQIALAAALAAVANIPQTIEFSQEIPEFGWVTDGYWSTTTSGQWVASPDDVADLPTAGQLAYLAYAIEHGDLSALAPVLNWTAYLTNVNLIAYGDGAIAVGQAYQAFIDSAKGNTPEGYNPFAVGDPETGPRKIKIVFGDGTVTVGGQTYTTNNPLDVPLPGDVVYPDAPPVGWESVQDGGVIDVTLLSLVLVRNPGRVNGGLYARFAPLYEELTGVNPVTPERQDVLPPGVDPGLITKLLTGNADGISFDELGNLQAVINSADGKPIVVTLKADVGWQYDLMSDAPATANPIAWANSVASSIFLTNLLTGVDFQDLGGGGYIGPDGTIYYTLPVDDLPLLAPLRSAAQAIGLATGNPDINTPFADAIEPALKMLVNLGYTDVVRNEDGTYTRTLDKFGEPTLFGTPTLNRAQAALVPGDLIAALGMGFGNELSDVLTRTKEQLVQALNLDLTAEQDQELEKALTALGTTITNGSRDLGNGVSQFFKTVESQLPEQQPVTQEDLEATQRTVGRELAAARDRVNDTVEKVTSVVGNGSNTVATTDKDGATAATPQSGSAATTSTPSTTRKTPVRGAATNAGSEINNVETKVSDSAKKPVGGDAADSDNNDKKVVTKASDGAKKPVGGNKAGNDNNDNDAGGGDSDAGE